MSSYGNSKNLRAYFSYSLFNTPDNEPYMETYLTINGASIYYDQLEDGTFKGAVEIQVLFKIGDSIVNYAKYELSSPVVKDTSNVNQNMLDIQRYGLVEGDYNIEISLKDLNSEEKAMTSSDKFTIDFPEGVIQFSDIELLTSFEQSDVQNSLYKNGYQLTPYVFNYFPLSMNTISFYGELYNTKDVLEDEAFLLSYYIRPFEAEKKLDQYIHRKRANPNEVITILGSFDIGNLPSGNYLLVFEARDRNNALLATKETFFQRYNPNVQFNITNLLVLNTSNTFVEDIPRDTL